MRKFRILRVYNLVNANGDKLRLNLGVTDDPLEEYPMSASDKGFRWNFEGHKIPMPVRSGYWFNGFSESVMLDWLKGNGWALHTVVNMMHGEVVVHDLPEAPDPEPNKATAKGNGWIPVSSGMYPKEGEYVNVTFLAHDTKEPMCGYPAYLDRNNWYWAEDGRHVEVEVTAWKPICEPYCGDEDVTEPAFTAYKGNDEYVMIPVRTRNLEKTCFNEAIRGLYEQGLRVDAVRAYRYANPVGLADAKKAVEAICANT